MTNNYRLNQKYFTAGDYEQLKKTPIKRILTGKAKTIIEPTFISLWGKNANMVINYFFSMPIDILKIDKNGNETVEEEDFTFCSLSFRNCIKEHNVVVNKIFMLCLAENGFADYDEHQNQINYDFDALKGKTLNGWIYCDHNGKGKKIFGTLESFQQYVSYIKELEERQAEEERAELKD